MSRKPNFIAPRDRGDVELDLSDVPEGGAFVDLDNDDPNHLEIVVEDDTPEQDRGRPTQVDDPLEVTEEELRSYGNKAQERIRRLTFERETERRRREELERELGTTLPFAQRLQQENQQLRQAVTASSATMAQSMLKERETELAVARQKLANAHNDGDGEAIAEATEAISRLTSEITTIKASQPKPRDPNAPPEQQRQPDPQAQPRQQPQLEPQVAAWIGNNRWFGQPGNEEKTAVAMAIHQRLTNSGVKPSSPEYVRGLDEGMKKVFPEHRAMSEPDQPDTSRGQREPARRDVTVGNGSRQQAETTPRKVALTASEIKLAKNLGITPQAYAASKLKSQQKQGSAR